MSAPSSFAVYDACAHALAPSNPWEGEARANKVLALDRELTRLEREAPAGSELAELLSVPLERWNGLARRILAKRAGVKAPSEQTWAELVAHRQRGAAAW